MFKYYLLCYIYCYFIIIVLLLQWYNLQIINQVKPQVSKYQRQLDLLVYSYSSLTSSSSSTNCTNQTAPWNYERRAEKTKETKSTLGQEL